MVKDFVKTAMPLTETSYAGTRNLVEAARAYDNSKK